MQYRSRSFYAVSLGKVPTNLLIDIFYYFVLAVGAKFSDERTYDNYLNQCLYIDDENIRHHEIISSALAYTNPRISWNSDDAACSSRWKQIVSDKVQLGGKLQPIHYIDEVLRLRRSHQMAKMIEHHFRHCDGKVVKVAKEFLELLSYRIDTGEIDIFFNSWYRSLLDRIEISADHQRHYNQRLEAKTSI